MEKSRTAQCTVHSLKGSAKAKRTVMFNKSGSCFHQGAKCVFEVQTQRDVVGCASEDCSATSFLLACWVELGDQLGVPKKIFPKWKLRHLHFLPLLACCLIFNIFSKTRMTLFCDLYLCLKVYYASMLEYCRIWRPMHRGLWRFMLWLQCIVSISKLKWNLITISQKVVFSLSQHQCVLDKRKTI